MGTDEMGTASKAGDVTCTNEKGSEKLFAPGLLDSSFGFFRPRRNRHDVGDEEAKKSADKMIANFSSRD